MTFLDHFREVGITDEEIISTFQFKTGGYSKTGKTSYRFSNSKDPEEFLSELHFNKKNQLYKITPGKQLFDVEKQIAFVNEALSDINKTTGHTILHRVLFSQRPLKGQFIWKDTFRIRPCLNLSQIGKDLAWGIDTHNLPETETHFGPPYPFILEVRTKKSKNHIIQTNRSIAALDFYQWLMSLLLPQLLGSPVGRNSQPKWFILQNDKKIEYHLAYEGFNAHESEIETGEEFTALNIHDAPRYTGSVVSYYSHLWSQSHEIELPIEIETLLNSIDNLNNKAKENFRRSLYWFNTGTRLYNQEELSIIPFTISIECLLANPSDEICETCKKPLADGPTKLFKDFLETHLSLPNNIQHLKKSIYPKRSSMVHGSYAFASDESFFSINKFNDSELFVENFIRRAIINWLITGKIE